MPLTRALFEHRNKIVEDTACYNGIISSLNLGIAIICHRDMWKGEGKS
jgi:hypothetical protein